jgi:hypothetical protein
LIWPNQVNGEIPALPTDILEDARRFLAYSASALDEASSPRRKRSPERTTAALRNATQKYQQSLLETAEGLVADEERDDNARDLRDKMYSSLHAYASLHAHLFGLDGSKTVAVAGFHAVHRVGVDQRLVVELVAQFTQTDEAPAPKLGGLQFRAGATIIFGSEGEVRYVASKPMPSPNLPADLQRLAAARLNAAEKYVADLDLRDPRMPLANQEYIDQRMTLRSQFRALHEGAQHG